MVPAPNETPFGVHEIRIAVGDEDLDVNGHVNNVRYVQWLQDVAWDHSRSVGWDVERYRDEGVYWVVREHRVRYLRAAQLGDPVRVWTWVKRFGKATAFRGFRILHAETGATLAEAETDWAMVRENGRPAPVPEEFKDAFELIEAPSVPAS